jgi:hypothetical protein
MAGQILKCKANPIVSIIPQRCRTTTRRPLNFVYTDLHLLLWPAVMDKYKIKSISFVVIYGSDHNDAQSAGTVPELMSTANYASCTVCHSKAKSVDFVYKRPRALANQRTCLDIRYLTCHPQAVWLVRNFLSQGGLKYSDSRSPYIRTNTHRYNTDGGYLSDKAQLMIITS